MLTPSIFIAPVGSAKRNKVESNEDFPAPVRPTTPIWNHEERKTQCFHSVLTVKTLYRQKAVYSRARFPQSKYLLKAILDLSNQKQKPYATKN